MPPSSLVAVLIVVAACGGRSLGVEPDQADRLRDLEARIAALETQPWLTTRRAEEIRRLTLDVLADAETRASLTGQDLTAGHDGDFFIASSDGTFRLEIGAQIQVRHVYNHQRNSDVDNDRWGFENRRTKLEFSGRVREHARFKVKQAFDPLAGLARLQDAYIEFEVAEDLDLRIGRFRPKVLREARSSSSAQLMVDRSLVRRAFRQLRRTGVSLTWSGDTVWFSTAFVDRGITPLSDDAWTVTARGELLLDGRFAELKDLTSFRGDDPVTALGAAVSYEDRGNDDNVVFEPIRTFTWTTDASLEFGGANLMAAVVGRHVDENGEPSRNQYGVVVQGGVFITDDLELVARYQWGDADDGGDNLSVIEIGFNRYFDRHDLKLTFDVGYGINAVSNDWDNVANGWREDANGNAGQVVVRTQVQLLF